MEEDYPRTLLEFEERFSTEAGCVDYLRGLRWPEGFICELKTPGERVGVCFIARNAGCKLR